MTTAKQMAANRRNARHSTGPKTARGKATSAQNATRHGLLAQTVVLHDEDPEECLAFYTAIREELDPQGEIEHLLVHQVALAAWRLRRAPRFEASLLAYHAASFQADCGWNEPTRTIKQLGAALAMPEDDPRYAMITDEAKAADVRRKAEVLGSAFAHSAKGADSFTRLARYETALERSLYKALHELERRQATRAGQAVPVPAVVEVEVSSPAG